MNDTLKKYLTTDHAARIQSLRLTDAWKKGLAHQDLPAEISQLLGELSAACVLLAGNIKFDGSIILQVQGTGAVSLMMVECSSTLDLRATAHIKEDSTFPAGITLQQLMNADGKGRFTVMLDPEKRAEGVGLYQGVVPLEGDTVAQALEHYMKHSEQLDTRLWLAADAEHCAGLMLQRMPSAENSSAQTARRHTEAEDATWNHCLTLAGTITPRELLGLDPDALIHRLFWQDDLLSFTGQAVRWHCSCSRDRVASMLRNLGQAEIESILAEQGHVHIDCHFCGKPYEFDAVDCAALFVDTRNQIPAPGSPLVH
ncbi:MAG TPA: Hsp33 family molecular chaperone HslO [Castellaniella sp.]|uniref:Hsp33 family molecular chaperone HslO n=1 Tax=Castellaniella sp. TaxID=1955812 RepID=UPI002EE0D28C